MRIFAYQFRVAPVTGFHLTVKQGYAAVYVKAKDVKEGRLMANAAVVNQQWEVLELVIDGFEPNPALHDLSDEALALFRQAQQFGEALAVAVVGIDPAADGSLN